MPKPLDVALADLSAELVTGYVVEYCRGRNTESAKAMVTALRSLLRFLHVTGRAGPLTGAVPAVANWRLAGLPRRLSAGQVEALIEGCDTDTAVGVRDRACWCCWPGWACAPPRRLRCSWRTWTGGPGRS